MAELRALLRLAGPLAAADVAWMSGTVAVTMLLGHLGAAAVGAAGLANILFFTAALPGYDGMLGLDYPVARAVGAGDLREAHRLLVNGLWLGVALAVVLAVAIRAGTPWLALAGVDPAVLPLADPYVRTLTWGLWPLFVYTATRRYLQARGLVRPVLVGLVLSAVVLAVGGWALVFGRLGAPALGTRGAAVATVLSWVVLGATLVVAVAASERRAPTGFRDVSWRPDAARCATILRLGLPAACRTMLEIGVFAAATTLAARLEPVALAAHQIALNAISVLFMVPLGISHAAGVRVGTLLGAGRPAAARHAGWTALGAVAAFACASGGLCVAAPDAILRAYTTDPAVVATGASLLLCAAAFALSDGVQIVGTGALRGTGDTRTPLVANVVAHWCVGLPLGWYLAFARGLGVVGLWLGLTTGLTLVGTVIVATWHRRARRLSSATPGLADAA